MTYFRILFPISLLFFFSCARPHSLVQLKMRIQHKMQEQKGQFALAWKDLQSGDSLFINADSTFHAASTMKTAVMVELFHQAFQKRFALSDSLTIHNSFTSIVDSSLFALDPQNDSEVSLYNLIGQKRTINELNYQMIIASSNLATNLIVQLVGAENTTNTLRRLGLAKMNVRRGVEDGKAFEAGLNNTTTARDLCLLFEKIEKDRFPDSLSSIRMLDVLLDQKFNEIIPALLPEDVKVAHKTGSITGVHHDSGVVYLPDGRRYILVLLSKELGDFEAGTKLLAEISRMIYEHMIVTS